MKSEENDLEEALWRFWSEGNEEDVKRHLIEVILVDCQHVIDTALCRGELRGRSRSLSMPRLSSERESTLLVGRRLKTTVDLVMVSREFIRCRDRVLRQCRMAVDQLKMRPNTAQLRQLISDDLFDDDDDDDDDRDDGEGHSFSFGQSFRFPIEADLEKTVKYILDPNSLLEQKKNALRSVLQMTAVSIVKSEWTIKILNDIANLILERELFEETLSLLVKLINSSEPQIVAMSIARLSESTPMVLKSDKLSITDKLKMGHILHQVLCACPILWRRLPLRYVHCIVEKCFKMFANVQLDDISISNCFLLLAILDGEAEWIRAWLHSYEYRLLLCKYLNEFYHNLCLFNIRKMEISHIEDQRLSSMAIFHVEDQQSSSMAISHIDDEQSSSTTIGTLLDYSTEQLNDMLIGYTQTIIITILKYPDLHMSIADGMINNIAHMITMHNSSSNRSDSLFPALLELSTCRNSSTILLQTEIFDALCSSFSSIGPSFSSIGPSFSSIGPSFSSIGPSFSSIGSSAILRLVRQTIENSEGDIDLLNEGQCHQVLQLLDHCDKEDEEAIRMLTLLVQRSSSINLIINLDKFITPHNLSSRQFLDCVMRSELSRAKNLFKQYKWMLNSSSLTHIDHSICESISYRKVLMDHLVNFLCHRPSTSTMTMTKTQFERHQRLDFLFDNNDRVNCPISPSPLIYIIAWQMDLSLSIIRYFDFENLIECCLVNCPKIFVTRLPLLMSNLDVVLELNDRLQLHKKLNKYLRRRSESSTIFIDELTIQIGQLIEGMTIGGPSEKRREGINSSSSSSSIQTILSPTFSLINCSVVSKKTWKGMPLTGNFLCHILSLLDQGNNPPSIPHSFVFSRFFTSETFRLLVPGFVEHHEQQWHPVNQNWTMLIDYAQRLGKLPRQLNKYKEQLAQLQVPYSTNVPYTDWFLAAVLLVFGFKIDQVQSALNALSQLPHASLIWPRWDGGEDFAEGISRLVFPLVMKQLKRQEMRPIRELLADVPLFHLLLLFSNQLYLNILDWPNTADYLLLSAIGGAPVQAAYFVAVLMHSRDEWQQSRCQGDDGDLKLFMTRPPIGFSIARHLGLVRSMTMFES